MTVVVLVGMPGSGKEIFVETAKAMGFHIIRMGDIVRQHAAASGLEMGDISVGGHADAERSRHGNEIWAIRTLEAMPRGDVIIDGSRSLDELAHFKKHIENFTIVGIDAPRETRLERLLARGREDDPKEPGDFERREAREKGWGLQEAIESADVIITNNSTLDSFISECRRVLSNIQGAAKVFNSARVGD